VELGAGDLGGNTPEREPEPASETEIVGAGPAPVDVGEFASGGEPDPIDDFAPVEPRAARAQLHEFSARAPPAPPPPPPPGAGGGPRGFAPPLPPGAGKSRAAGGDAAEVARQLS